MFDVETKTSLTKAANNYYIYQAIVNTLSEYILNHDSISDHA